MNQSCIADDLHQATEELNVNQVISEAALCDKVVCVAGVIISKINNKTTDETLMVQYCVQLFYLSQVVIIVESENHVIWLHLLIKIYEYDLGTILKFPYRSDITYFWCFNA